MVTENESCSIQQHRLIITASSDYQTMPLESAASIPLQIDKLHQSCVLFASYMSVFCQIRTWIFLCDVRHKSDFTCALFLCVN